MSGPVKEVICNGNPKCSDLNSIYNGGPEEHFRCGKGVWLGVKSLKRGSSLQTPEDCPYLKEQECATLPTEKYKGEEIDHIVVDPAYGKYAQKVEIYLRNGSFFTVRPHRDVSHRGIISKLNLDRSFWGRIENKEK